MTSDAPSPEMELVVACSDYEPSSDRLSELAERDLDWERTYETARLHQVRPLVYRRLASTAPGVVPDEVLARLREDCTELSRRNLLAGNQLATLLDRFDEHGIRALPFKGPVIAEQIYGDLSRREFLDIDVLVGRDQLAEAVDLAEAVGYEWVYDAPRLDDRLVRGGRPLPTLISEYAMRPPNYGVTVEFRCRVGGLVARFENEFEQLWARAEPTDLGFADVRILDPIDRLLILTYHGTKHLWECLKWLGDVAWTLRSQDIEWDVLLTRARRYNAERSLLLGLDLTNRLFDVSLPYDLRKRIDDDGVVSSLREQTFERVFGRPTRRSPPREKYQKYRYRARGLNSSWGPLVTFGRAVFEPKIGDYLFCPLPGRYHALYYPIRLVRLLTEGVRSLRSDGNGRS